MTTFIIVLALLIVNTGIAAINKNLHSTAGWLLSTLMFLQYEGVLY